MSYFRSAITQLPYHLQRPSKDLWTPFDELYNLLIRLFFVRVPAIIRHGGADEVAKAGFASARAVHGYWYLAESQ